MAHGSRIFSRGGDFCKSFIFLIKKHFFNSQAAHVAQCGECTLAFEDVLRTIFIVRRTTAADGRCEETMNEWTNLCAYLLYKLFVFLKIY